MSARRMNLGVLAVLAASLVLGACGGGGANGGGGGAAAAFLELMSEPAFGTLGNTNGVQPFAVVPGGSAMVTVQPTNFASAQPGDSNFIEIEFSDTVMASTVMSGGINLRNSNGDLVSFFLDDVGAIDATNAFPEPGVAPKRLRLYVEDTFTPGTPARLLPDGYRVEVDQSVLRSGAGRPFCAMKADGSCASNTQTRYYFTLDGQNTPTPGADAPLATGPTPALPLPAATGIAVDDEIRVFFDAPVDFQSIVGVNTTSGLVNTTTQDPFCSVPFTGANIGQNMSISYAPPGVSVLPMNYGYIVYQPNPFRDPSEVRIRFVDVTLAVPLDDPMGMFSGNGLPTNQNYSIGPEPWRTARLVNGVLTPPTDTSSSQNGFLLLPPKLPLPGSTTAGNASITITFFSPTNAGATDSTSASPAPDGVLGVTDRARRPLANDIVITRILEAGPPIGNNQLAPDMHYIPSGTTLGGVSSAAVTANATAGGVLTGNLFPINNRLDDPNTIGSVRDIAFGAFINGANGLGTRPRRNNNASIIAQGIDPGIPFPPGGTPEAGGAAQPLGQRLYLVDDTNNQVRVLNSHTFQPMGIIPAVTTPRGIAIDPTGQFAYISDFDAGTIVQVGVLPTAPNLFHSVISRINVGAGPTAVSVQPGNEDVLVINSLENSLSFVDVPSRTERFQTPVGMGAHDIFVTPRWVAPGATFSFWAFVPNTFSDTVTIYESDSPLLTVPNGPEGKIIEERTGFAGPRGGAWNRNTGGSAGFASVGALIANSQGNSITHFGLTFFNNAPTPGFMGPPLNRTFTDMIQYQAGFAGSPSDVTIDGHTFQSGTQRVVLATYPGANGQVAAIAYGTGVFLGSVSMPGTSIFGVLDQ